MDNNDFFKDKRKRATTSDNVEKRPRADRKPREEAPRKPFSGGKERRSFNPNFTADNKLRDGSEDKPRFSDKPRNSKPYSNDRPRRDNDKMRDGKPGYGDKPRFSDKSRDDKPRFGDRSRNDEGKPRFGDKPRYGEGKPRDNKPYSGDRPRRDDDKPKYGEGKPRFGDKPRYGNDKPRFGDKPRSSKPYSDDKPRRDNDKTGYGEGKPRFSDKSDFGDKPRRDDNKTRFGDKPRYGNDKPRFGDRPRRDDDKSRYSDKPRFGDKPRYGDDKPSKFAGKPGGKSKPTRVHGENADGTYPTFTPPTPVGEVRLNRHIAASGRCSRRDADLLIRDGHVTVNGEVVTEMGFKVAPTDVVELDGKEVGSEKKVYILMNKPKGFVTTLEDPHADKTVIDLLSDNVHERVYPVGRLDKNSLGVLLLTNDGDLTSRLTHPSHNKKKVYQVTLDRALTQADMQQISDGLTLEDGPIYVDAIDYVSESRKEVGLEIHSGRNRIVRRIFEHLGYKVSKLDRVYFAGLTKRNLKRGQWRFLTTTEVDTLRNGMYE